MKLNEYYHHAKFDIYVSKKAATLKFLPQKDTHLKKKKKIHIVQASQSDLSSTSIVVTINKIQTFNVTLTLNTVLQPLHSDLSSCTIKTKFGCERISSRSVASVSIHCGNGHILFTVSLVSWCFEPSQPQRITSGLILPTEALTVTLTLETGNQALCMTP